MLPVRIEIVSSCSVGNSLPTHPQVKHGLGRWLRGLKISHENMRTRTWILRTHIKARLGVAVTRNPYYSAKNPYYSGDLQGKLASWTSWNQQTPGLGIIYIYTHLNIYGRDQGKHLTSTLGLQTHTCTHACNHTYTRMCNHIHMCKQKPLNIVLPHGLAI